MNPETLGAAYVPFTFPTVTVQVNARKAGYDLSYSEIDQLWPIYRAGQLERGLKPFRINGDSANNAAVIRDLQAMSAMDRLKVIGWLLATAETVNQGWSSQWIDPANYTGGYVSEIAKDAITEVGGVLKTTTTAVVDAANPVIGPVTNLAKWAALIALGGAAIYLAYNYKALFGGRK